MYSYEVKLQILNFIINILKQKILEDYSPGGGSHIKMTGVFVVPFRG